MFRYARTHLAVVQRRSRFRSRNVTCLQLASAVLLLVGANVQASADEIWTCAIESESRTTAIKNVYISGGRLWFAGAMVRYLIIENNDEHIIAYNLGKWDKHTAARSWLFLERPSGRLTEVLDANMFHLPEGENTPELSGHWDCRKMP